ncbi:neprilysin-2-like isoform X2 [Diachasmimorpha longicaudata]
MQQSETKIFVRSNRQSTLKHGPMVGVVFPVFLFLTSMIPVGEMVPVLNMLKDSNGTDNICTTAVCHHIADEVKRKMDPTVQPCDDFYKFACGGFLRNTLIPSDRGEVTMFSALSDKVLDQLRNSFEQLSPLTERKPFKLVQDFYNVCMNATNCERQPIETLRKDLLKLGEWPLLIPNKWVDQEFKWFHVNFRFMLQGHKESPFLSFDKDEVSGLYKLSINHKHLSTKQSFKEKPMHALNFMVDLLVNLEVERDVAVQELTSAIEFMEHLNTISQDKNCHSADLYKNLTLNKLENEIPGIPWKWFLFIKNGAGIELNDNQVVMIPNCTTAILDLIEKTPNKILANYAMLIAMDTLAKMENEKIYAFPQWKRCVKIVSNYLPVGVEALYVKHHFLEENKENVAEMVQYIKHQLMQIPQTADWIENDSTRNQLLQKLALLSVKIGYREEQINDTMLDEYYENLEISQKNYLQARWNIILFYRGKKNFDSSSWDENQRLTAVQAFYKFVHNTIEVSAAILQSPFVNNDRPKYMNYGAIGSIIGHEMIHHLAKQISFDNETDLVDWSSSAKEKLLSKSQCIINQYGTYSVEGLRLNLNGSNTHQENTADNGGTKLAYLAYKDWSSRNQQELMLPGLFYTPQQMFWISLAQTWCSVHQPETLKQHINNDIHSPSEFRVLGPLSNSLEFFEDFQCPVGSKMNPKEKCVI